MYGLLTQLEVWVGGYCHPSFCFFCAFMDEDQVEVHKLPKQSIQGLCQRVVSLCFLSSTSIYTQL